MVSVSTLTEAATAAAAVTAVDDTHTSLEGRRNTALVWWGVLLLLLLLLLEPLHRAHPVKASRRRIIYSFYEHTKNNISIVLLTDHDTKYHDGKYVTY